MNGNILDILRRTKRKMNYILLKLGIKDVYFYAYIWSFILRTKKSQEWQMYNLRHDWVGRIYTVRSIKTEDELLPEEVKRVLIAEQIKSLVDFLTSKNLSEILSPTIEPIQGTNSYLIKFTPLFYEISIGWFFRRVILTCVAYLVYPYLKNIFEYYVSK